MISHSRRALSVSVSSWLAIPFLLIAPSVPYAQQEQSPSTPEGVIYRAGRGSVFRVEAGLGHGSGFLVDVAGLVVTNDHVIGTAAKDVTVYVDSATRLQAAVLNRDADADLAVLQIAPVCGTCQPLNLGASRPLAPGDRLVALGFPLNQPLTIISGMVGAVRAGAIVVDMSINPGNSGGPVLTLDGSVVGVAAFRDVDEGGIGPGLGGAVAIERLIPILDQARRMASKPPPDKRLPVVPTTSFPLALLKTTADTIDAELYAALGTFDAGSFNVSVTTPLSRLVAALGRDRDVTRERRQREEKAGVPAAERYTDLGQVRDWAEYVGLPTAPVVAIKIEPKIAETTGSAIGRGIAAALGSLGGAANMKFQGDVRGVTLKRNGQTAEPLRGGHAPVRVAIENVLVTLKDVADFGYYVYPPEVFRPDSPQKPPEITLEVEDLKAPARISRQTLPPAMIARIWNDFEAYYRHTQVRTLFPRYVLTKSCAVNSGAAAMGGVGGVASTGETTQCAYVLAPPSK